MISARPAFLRAALSDDDIRTVLAALAAVSPSGGGSTPYTLLRKLQDASGLEPVPAAVLKYQTNAAGELPADDLEWLRTLAAA